MTLASMAVAWEMFMLSDLLFDSIWTLMISEISGIHHGW